MFGRKVNTGKHFRSTEFMSVGTKSGESSVSCSHSAGRHWKSSLTIPQQQIYFNVCQFKCCLTTSNKHFHDIQTISLVTLFQTFNLSTVATKKCVQDWCVNIFGKAVSFSCLQTESIPDTFCDCHSNNLCSLTPLELHIVTVCGGPDNCHSHNLWSLTPLELYVVTVCGGPDYCHSQNVWSLCNTQFALVSFYLPS